MASPPPPSASKPGQPLRIVFMGTPQLAAHILERLLEAPPAEFKVVGVVTRPDSPQRRGLKLEPSEVGIVAEWQGLPTLKPVKIRSEEFREALRALQPDVLVIAAYGRILPREVLETPRIMPINVHASLLPRFRGAAPVEGAILAGEHETGVTIMRVIERMDAGPILLQRKIPISLDETQGSLKQKIAEIGTNALLEALEMLSRGKLAEAPQDDNLATYTSPIAKEHAVIDWQADAVQIERMTRAYDPWPVARTRLNGEDLLIWRAGLSPLAVGNEAAAQSGSAIPGTIVSLKPHPVVQCGVGMLALLEVQSPGRRRMPANDFIRGRRIAIGARLGI
ncbi:MAG TPA: methionyl-tRNA formyltransferase [Candidatus Binataceae bacterium]|nr:methionyl-tRNA formyltransferase [Candidatus Binataceae bacterium]